MPPKKNRAALHAAKKEPGGAPCRPRRTEIPLHATPIAHRKATLWLLAIVGCLALLLVAPAISRADESNPNNLNCLGSIAKGEAEEEAVGNAVAYSFYCNGPITGYQLQSQVPLAGVGGAPLVSKLEAGVKPGPALKDTFSRAAWSAARFLEDGMERRPIPCWRHGAPPDSFLAAWSAARFLFLVVTCLPQCRSASRLCLGEVGLNAAGELAPALAKGESSATPPGGW